MDVQPRPSLSVTLYEQASSACAHISAAGIAGPRGPGPGAFCEATWVLKTRIPVSPAPAGDPRLHKTQGRELKTLASLLLESSPKT